MTDKQNRKAEFMRYLLSGRLREYHWLLWRRMRARQRLRWFIHRN